MLAHPSRVEPRRLGQADELQRLPVFLREGAGRVRGHLAREQPDPDPNGHRRHRTRAPELDRAGMMDAVRIRLDPKAREPCPSSCAPPSRRGSPRDVGTRRTDADGPRPRREAGDRAEHGRQGLSRSRIRGFDRRTRAPRDLRLRATAHAASAERGTPGRGGGDLRASRAAARLRALGGTSRSRGRPSAPTAVTRLVRGSARYSNNKSAAIVANPAITPTNWSSDVRRSVARCNSGIRSAPAM